MKNKKIIIIIIMIFVISASIVSIGKINDNDIKIKEKQKNTVETKIIDIYELYNHPNNYIEKNISIYGMWHESNVPYYDGCIVDITETGLIIFANITNINTSELYHYGEYTFTGFLRIEEIYYQDSYILDVYDITWSG